MEGCVCVRTTKPPSTFNTENVMQICYLILEMLLSYLILSKAFKVLQDLGYHSFTELVNFCQEFHIATI